MDKLDNSTKPRIKGRDHDIIHATRDLPAPTLQQIQVATRPQKPPKQE